MGFLANARNSEPRAIGVRNLPLLFLYPESLLSGKTHRNKT